MTSDSVQQNGPNQSSFIGDYQVQKLSVFFNRDIPSDPKFLDDAVEEITRTIDGTTFWGDVEGIGLAVREAIANAIVHGNNCDPARTVRVSTSVNEDGDLLITVKDSGSGFDPSRIANPTAAPNLLAAHGRGIFLIKQFMDQVDFKFDHGTEVRMRKRCKNSQVVIGSPNSPTRRGRLKRASHGPAQARVGDVAEALCKEDSMEFKGDRDTVRKRDQGLQLALSGDQEALGRLLASYMPQLYRVALRVLDTPQDAEDALQDGLVQVVQHFREFEGRSRLSTWLTRIVINAALMRLRRSRPEVMTSIDQKFDQEALSLADTTADPGPNPEEICAQEELLQILKRKLSSLPAAHGSAFWLRYVQGMSTREAAQAMGVPEGTVKSHVHRARLRLRNEVGAACGTHKTPRAARSNATTTGHRLNVEFMGEGAKPAREGTLRASFKRRGSL